MSTLTLRPYQEEAILKTRSSLAGGKRRVVLYLPTGGGKTVIAAGIIRNARAKGKRVIFVCNRVELVLQTADSFRAFGIDCGVIQADNTRAAYAPTLVCSVQTLASRGWPEADLVIIDECHGVPGSKAYLALLKHFACPVIGLTATPFAKGMGKNLPELGGLVFEDMVTAATIPELIAAGYLVDLDIYSPSEPDLKGVKTVAGDYHEGQLAEAVDKPALIGDIVQHWLKLAAGTQTVCFATSIAHSRHIVESFRAAGVSAEHLDCYMPANERRAIVDGFKAHAFTVLSNCALLSEGFDAPATSTMILARPTKSLIRYIQMAGRVLRPADGKTRALMLDHSGTAKRLGFPTDDLPLELDDGKPRTGSAEKEKEEALPKECPTCHYLKPPKVLKCPACGFKPERQNDIEVAAGTLSKLQRKKAAEAQFGSKQAVFSMLVAYAQKKGWSRGAVSHKYRDIFGVWPQGLSHTPMEPSTELLSWLKSKQIRWAKSQCLTSKSSAASTPSDSQVDPSISEAA